MARKSPPKTNAMRALDAHKIPYSTFFYAETIHSADEVAALLGVPAGHVYKDAGGAGGWRAASAGDGAGRPRA